jgi:hypothetical protein
MKRVLIVSPVATHPPHRGNRQRILQVANLFRSSGYHIELAIGRNRPITEEARAFWPTINRLKVIPRWKPSHKISQLDSWYTPGLGEEIADLVATRKIDVVVLNYVFHSRVLDFLPKSVVAAIDTHDVFTDRHELYLGKRLAGGFFSCSVADEKTYVSRAHATLAITEHERKHFSGIQDPRRVFEIPFAASPVSIGARDPNPADNKKSFGLVLSANDLNLASLSSFIKAVDFLYGRNPPFAVKVAGGVDKFAYRYFPHRIPFFCRRWLDYLGEVDDIDTFYRSLDAVVVPVISGSGMAIKFAESIARGIPTISTIAGSRGHITTNPFHTLPDNSAIAAALGDLGSADLPPLAAASRQCHDATQKITQKNWRLFTQFLEDQPSGDRDNREKPHPNSSDRA